jgi:hypothetical protein
MSRELNYRDLVGSIQFVPKFHGALNFIIKGDGLYRRDPRQDDVWEEVRMRDAYLELRLGGAPESVLDAFKYWGASYGKLVKLLSDTGEFRVKKITRVASNGEVERYMEIREHRPISAVVRELTAGADDLGQRQVIIGQLYTKLDRAIDDLLRDPSDVRANLMVTKYGISLEGEVNKLWKATKDRQFSRFGAASELIGSSISNSSIWQGVHEAKSKILSAGQNSQYESDHARNDESARIYASIARECSVVYRKMIAIEKDIEGVLRREEQIRNRIERA